MRMDRLFSIVVILLNKDKTTAKELAERFEVSTRTIYRDIDVLSSAGIPVYTNKGNGGGISLLENYTLSKTMISQKESEGLLFALKTLQATKYPNVDTIINKLSSLFKNTTTEDWIEVDFIGWEGTPTNVTRFNDIKQATINSQAISFVYLNSYGQKTKRTVNPIKLIYKGQAWYLWAYCELKKDFRLFKLNRIKKLKVTEKSFEREKLVALEKKINNIEDQAPIKTVELKLRFKPIVAYRLFDYFDETELIKQHDDTYVVNTRFPEDEWVYSFIQSFGDNVEVIAPIYVREEIIRRLKENLKKYIHI